MEDFGWLCDRVMPCSCRNDKSDREYGKHLRFFRQEFGKEGRVKFYEWVCSCGKKKPVRCE
jgi:hypothetical protein